MGKKAKVSILGEFCAVCDYHRKYSIRLLNHRGKPSKRRRPGRKPTYASAELLTVLKRFLLQSRPKLACRNTKYHWRC